MYVVCVGIDGGYDCRPGAQSAHWWSKLPSGIVGLFVCLFVCLWNWIVKWWWEHRARVLQCGGTIVKGMDCCGVLYWDLDLLRIGEWNLCNRSAIYVDILVYALINWGWGPPWNCVDLDMNRIKWMTENEICWWDGVNQTGSVTHDGSPITTSKSRESIQQLTGIPFPRLTTVCTRRAEGGGVMR